MRRPPLSVAQLLFMLAIVLRPARPESVLVTVQTKSYAEMDALTAAIDAAAEDIGGPTRSTLGVIEATASRVVDVDSPYLQTVPQSVPTLAMLSDVHYDLAENKWTFTYQSMRIDPNDPINQFKRVLYLTKRVTNDGPQWSTGDSANTCLLSSTTNTVCLDNLEQQYTVPQSLQEDNDYLVFAETEGVTSTVTNVENSLLQNIVITIPHARIREYVEIDSVNMSPLSYEQEIVHPIEGARTQYTFGIGMLFYGSGTNQVIFDQFHLIENNRDQLAISRETSYSVARHVSFWTQRVQQDPTTRIVLVEYLLDTGHVLNSINASINGRQVILDTDCADMQARVDALENPSCLTQYPLCVPQTYVTTEGQVQTWASYVLPLPEWADESVTSFRVNTLLNTTTPDGRTILSTLNFETSHEPTDVCSSAVAKEFSPSDHVAATVYRGHGMEPTVIDGTFTIENTTSIGMPDALMTLVLAPRDAAADAYFAEFTTEYINLDDLYMSHALDDSVLPLDISNTMTGVSGGRAAVVLDPDLLSACPLEDDGYDPSPESTNNCVTTRDWMIDGAQIRITSPNLYFVRRFTNSDADLEWLKGNIFADDTPSAEAFRAATATLTSNAHAQTYWIWPIFQWPGASPIGLKDTTVVSFAWSVSSSPPPATSRRLLGLPGVQQEYGTDMHKQKAATGIKRRAFKSTSGLKAPKVDYAHLNRIQAVQRQKIARLQRYVPKLFA